mmetsp:Transcript_18615/g.38260  ORF Transcript_18615/g.38260 Transcript_18615/m.38260 type:complete len:117 (-) Transcript_18615:526-876(-)
MRSFSTTTFARSIFLHKISWSDRIAECLPTQLESTQKQTQRQFGHAPPLSPFSSGLWHAKHRFFTSIDIPVKLLPQLNATSHNEFLSCSACCNPTKKYSLEPTILGAINRTDSPFS